MTERIAEEREKRSDASDDGCTLTACAVHERSIYVLSTSYSLCKEVPIISEITGEYLAHSYRVVIRLVKRHVYLEWPRK